MNFDDYAARAIDPESGRIRPFSEVMEGEIRADHAAQRASALAKHAEESRKTDLERSIEAFQREYDHARRNDDRARAKFLRTHLTTLKEQHAAETASKQKAELFANHRLIQLAREEAGLVERSGRALYPNASQIDLDSLIAIARSEAYPDPESQYADYKELADRLTDAEIKAERVKASDAEQVAAQQMAARAESEGRVAELALAKARREVPNAE